MNGAVLLTLVTLVGATPEMEIQGHRGARSVLPENSIPAFLHALDAGAHVLEMDTVVTSDDQVVVLHDPVLNPKLCAPVGGGDLKNEVVVRAITLEALRGYHCTRLLKRFPRQKAIDPLPIPTLGEVLAAVAKHPRGDEVRFNIETKINPSKPTQSPKPERFAQLFIDALKAAGVMDRSVIQSFDPRTLVAARRLAPSLKRAILLWPEPKNVVAEAKNVNASIVSPYHGWLTAEHVKAIHGAGLTVVPWTANEPPVWERLLALGVDGIITDDPAALRAWLKARSAKP